MIIGDAPIQNKKEDALNRYDFAEHIATGILKWESNESLCLALHGPWGSGKTSIINLCLEAIEEQAKNLESDKRPIIVRFQPWLISGQEQLISTFLDELKKALKKPNVSRYANVAADQLEIYEKLLGIASIIPPVTGFAITLKAAVAGIRGATQTVSKHLEKSLEANKHSISDALSKLSSPIIIVIDDVDRLTPEEVRQLFKLIKAVADFPRTIYFLAFDPIHIEKSLEPFQGGGQTGYIEKIVQLAFEIPNPTERQLATILWEGLADILATIPSEEHESGRWNEVRFGALPALFRNVRDVKRYLNAVKFRFPIIKGEVSSVDLLIIEAINLFAPALYRAIKNNKEFLISDSRRVTGERKEKSDLIAALPEMAPSFCRDELKEMLSLLFPEIESALQRHGWGGDFITIWRDNQRVCISSYFDFYFQGTLAEGAVSAKETNIIIGVLHDRSSLASALRAYVSDGRFTELLSKVERHLTKNIDSNAVENLLVCIFESGEQLPLNPNAMFDSPSDWYLLGTMIRLLRNLDPSLRKDVVLGAMSSRNDAISLPVALANRVWRQWHTSDGTEKPDEQKLLTKEEAEQVKHTALSLLRKYRDSEVLYKARNLLSILYNWERWSDTREVQEFVENILCDDSKIPEFLSGCGGFESSSGMGSHYSTHKFRIDPKALERFCDIESLRTRCENLLNSSPEWLTETSRLIVNVFLDGFRRRGMFDDD